MDLDKKYKDIDGNECNILEAVKRSPEWAANIIQYYEYKLESVAQRCKYNLNNKE